MLKAVRIDLTAPKQFILLLYRSMRSSILLLCHSINEPGSAKHFSQLFNGQAQNQIKFSPKHHSQVRNIHHSWAFLSSGMLRRVEKQLPPFRNLSVPFSRSKKSKKTA
jgi:hypothetical protein